MGGKGSKGDHRHGHGHAPAASAAAATGAGGSHYHQQPRKEQKEIISNIRHTIRKQPDIQSLAQQFRQASKINIEQLQSSSQWIKQQRLLNSIQHDTPAVVLQILRSTNATIKTKLDHVDNTILHLAAIFGKPSLIKSLISSLDIDINVANRQGDTPLLLALKCGHGDCTRDRGHNGDDDESKIIETIAPLLQDSRINITRTNAVGASPLSIAIVKGYPAIIKLLCTKIKVYAPIDLAMAIKLGLIYERDDLVELILGEMDESSELEFKELLEKNPELQSLGKALRELGGAGKNVSFDVEPAEEEGAEAAHSVGGHHQQQQSKLPPDIMLTVSTTAQTLASKITQDQDGHDLHIGNLIEIGPEELVSSTNPRIAEELDFIESVANQRAYIHDIDSQGDIYIDVLDTPDAGHISSKCVKYLEAGPRQRLDDGLEVGIGYYVQIEQDIELVKKLAKGHGGWKDEMEEFCGKTGRIRKIDKDGDCFIHFYNGKRHCFNPKSLKISSAASVEAKDYNGNWLRKGVYARVISNLDEFITLQQEIELDEVATKYEQILGELVRVRKLRLFLQFTDAVILLNNGLSYNINPKCLQLIQPLFDANGVELNIGSVVCVLKENVSSTDNLDKLIIGKTGHVNDINEDSKEILVDFGGGLGSCWLNLKIISAKNDVGGGGSSLGLPNLPSRRVRNNSDDIGYVSREFRISNDNERNNSTGSISSRVSAISSGGGGGGDGKLRLKQPEPDVRRIEIYNTKFGHTFLGLQLIPRKDLIMKKKLGEGGFGCVTTGTWKGSDCAIKQIRPIVLSDIDYDSILKEARIQYGLKHPNIVQLYGISYETDLWMVMQLINGMDLHTILFKKDEYGSREKIGPSYKVKICLQTTNAISYLHEKGFIHNDIKPENLMIERKTGNVYVCDFGITRYLGSTDLRTYSQKYTTSFGGTLPYIAPECFQKDEQEHRYLSPTFKSDMWSLGAVFTELFTEKELFRTEKQLYLYKIMNDCTAIKTALRLIGEVKIRNILGKCLDTEAELRPTADELNEFFLSIM